MHEIQHMHNHVSAFTHMIFLFLLVFSPIDLYGQYVTHLTLLASSINGGDSLALISLHSSLWSVSSFSKRNSFIVQSVIIVTTGVYLRRYFKGWTAACYHYILNAFLLMTRIWANVYLFTSLLKRHVLPLAMCQSAAMLLLVKVFIWLVKQLFRSFGLCTSGICVWCIHDCNSVEATFLTWHLLW